MDVQQRDPERAGPGVTRPEGLSQREAETRRRRGEGNVAVSRSSRSRPGAGRLGRPRRRARPDVPETLARLTAQDIAVKVVSGDDPRTVAMLILFREPPNRFFASRTRPDGDRRPAALVAGLVIAFSAGLFVPAFTTYFGLTDAADPVFFTVLPALVLWFALLSAAYRYRLLDRALGLAELSDQRGH